MGKAVHEIEVDRPDPAVAQQSYGALCDFEGLDTVDRPLDVLVEILNSEARPIDAGFGSDDVAISTKSA